MNNDVMLFHKELLPSHAVIDVKNVSECPDNHISQCLYSPFYHNELAALDDDGFIVCESDSNLLESMNLTEDGIENVVVESSLGGSVKVTDPVDEPCIFTQAYSEPNICTGEEFGQSKKWSTPIKEVSFANIPLIGHIDVTFVEKYLQLFVKSVTDHWSEFKSPLELLEISSGNTHSNFPKSGYNDFHSCHLHFLPNIRHYVVTKVVEDQDDVSIVVYDSHHLDDHMHEMIDELKGQLIPLFEKIPKIQLCCPQTSLPYSNHALFALATFQVLSHKGDPCLVRFDYRKMRDKLRSINDETLKSNLLFPHIKLSVPKQHKRWEWMGKIADYHAPEDENDANDEEPSNCGLFTTMVTPRHLVSDEEVRHAIKRKQIKKGKSKETWDDILSVAPSENQIPRNPFMDQFSEEMTYPGLFGGKPRSKPIKPVSYHKRCKSELRNKDRRFARHHENVFFKTRKSQIKLISDLELVSLRKVIKKDGSNYTAKDLKQNKENLIHHNEGYRFLKSVRGSPAYFEKVKKNVFAMMRFHGKPTFFVTFSAAESMWPDLLKNLGKVVDNKEYSDEEIENMSAKEKQRLITADPITCARHFNHRTHLLFKEFFTSSNSPFEMTEFFYRVEFQKRGSPHLHCLIWVKDAPIFDKENASEIADYVDQFISCSKYLNVPVLSLDEQEKLIARQVHRHTRTCPAKNKVCRFNFPKPPMDQTTVLSPFEKGTKESPLTPTQLKQLAKHKADFKRIEEALNGWSEQPQNYKIDSMADFLKYLKMSYQDYISAIRTSIHTDTVFLKRNVNERWINGYNPQCLAIWKANMDCQYVVNGYAAASYILDYVTKGERGLSETLRVASKEAAYMNMTQKASLKHISKRFIDFSEIGAQEAAYYLLGIPLYYSSNSVVFVPTGEDSAKICKPDYETDMMHDDDEDIFVKNSIDRYAERPRCLDGICLAEYVAYYDGLASFHKGAQKLHDEEFAPEREQEQIDDDQPKPEQETVNMHGLKKRKKPRIIRSVNFNVETHEEEHFRELIVLYSSYRDIKTILGNSKTYKDRYKDLADEIDRQRYIYSKFASDFAGLENLPNRDDNDENEVMQNMAPGAEQLQADGQAQQEELEQNLPLPERIPSSLLSKSYHQEDDWSENRFYDEVARLNKKQYQFVAEFLFHLKSGPSDEQIMWFLSGGAGVGKTTAVNVLYEGVRRYFNSLPNEDHSSLQIVKCAYTGKASHQVQGYTIHTLFKMPFGEEKKKEGLNPHKLAELQDLLGNLKVLVIDEISMVDNSMWLDISTRLQKIMKNKIPFGGVHVLAVGDLFQLLPFKGRPLWRMGDVQNNVVQGAPIGAIGGNIWEEKIKLFEFDEIMRQRDEKPWAEFLNRLRESGLSDQDCEYIKEQIIDKDHAIIPDASYITLTNDHAEFFNDQWFMLSPPDKQFIINCEDDPTKNAPTSLEMRAHFKKKATPSDLRNLPGILKLAIGQEYDFVTNLDIADGLTNGTPCIAKKYQVRIAIKTKEREIVWVDPQDPRVGKMRRQKYAHLYNSDIPKHWLPVLKETVNCSKWFFIRKQFPLRPSKARTVDRTQGATLNKVVVDFSNKKRTKTEHCHYVAFSRCPSKGNLFVLGEEGLALGRIKHEQLSINEMERLRLEARLQLTLPCLFDLENEYFNVYFLNAQSILGKFRALESDWNIRGCSVVGIVDTRFKQGEERNLANFQQPGIFYSNNTRPSLGIAVYSKVANNFHCHFLLTEGKGSMVVVRYESLKVNISYLYILPDSPSEVYIDALDKIRTIHSPEIPLILMGDFNKNPNMLPSAFTEGLKEFCLRQLIRNKTHNRGNILDHIYTNIADDFLKYGILNTLTKSDHIPVFISIKKSYM